MRRQGCVPGDGWSQVSVLVLLKGEEAAAENRPEAGVLEGKKALVQQRRLCRCISSSVLHAMLWICASLFSGFGAPCVGPYSLSSVPGIVSHIFACTK